MTQQEKQIIVAEIERLEEEARKTRISREVTTNQAIGADGQVKLCTRLKDFINSLHTEEEWSEYDDGHINSILGRLAAIEDKGFKFVSGFDIDEDIKWIENFLLHKPKFSTEDYPMPEDTVIFQKGVAEGRRLEREDAKWSEEDEMRLNHLIEFVEKHGLEYYAATDKVIAWLKSLRPQKKEGTLVELAKDACSSCGDNRFELIERAKQDILAKTNIESSPDEMKVLDNILFRAWQMGWLSKYDVVVPEQKQEGWITDRMPAETKHSSDNLQGHSEWTESDAVLAYDSMYGCYIDSTKNGKWRSEERSGYQGQVCHGIIAWMPLPPEPSCQTCTNDKGCVTCKDKELWEGEPISEPADIDLEKEIERWVKGNPAYEDEPCPAGLFKHCIYVTAKHFYELGKKSHWKPSEEQMEALEYVIRDYREDSCNATANYLQEILDHLKNM